MLRFGIAANIVSALAFSTEGLLSVRSIELGADAGVALVARYVLALAIITAWYYARPRPREAIEFEAGIETRRSTNDVLLLLFGGMLAHGAVPRFLFEAFLLIPTWLAFTTFFTYPALVMIGGHLLGRERIDSVRLLTLATAFVGIFLVAGRTDGAAAIDPRGILLGFGAALANSIFFLSLDPVLQRVRVEKALVLQIAGATSLHVMLLLAGGSVAARIAETAPAWPWLVGLALVPSALAVAGMNVAIHAIGAGRVAIINMLQPVFVLIFGVTLLGESISIRQGIGAGLVGIGVLGIVALGSRSASAVEPNGAVEQTAVQIKGKDTPQHELRNQEVARPARSSFKEE